MLWLKYIKPTLIQDQTYTGTLYVAYLLPETLKMKFI